MKKEFVVMVLFLIISFFLTFYLQGEKIETQEIIEDRGVFVSYIELSNYLKGKNQKNGEIAIKEIVTNIEQLGFNMIILQVRTFSDAIYPSSIYPWSSVVSNVEGEPLDYDILDTFLTFCHEKNIRLFAWINPYRIRGDEDITDLSVLNPAAAYLNTSAVYISDGVYYNPANEKNKELIVSGVEEIIKKYDVDGILFDDYFYPTTDTDIDAEEYTEYQDKNTNATLAEFRLKEVTDLIKRVYQLCHQYDVLFAVSPDGNIDNNYQLHYADVKLWGSREGYVDYIMPQIYYGFYNETKPFIDVLEEWENISTEVYLMPVLAFYKVGTVDQFAKGGMTEWMENDDIIMREILLSRNLKRYRGFSLFRYDFLFNPNVQTATTMLEMKNMKKIIK